MPENTRHQHTLLAVSRSNHMLTINPNAVESIEWFEEERRATLTFISGRVAYLSGLDTHEQADAIMDDWEHAFSCPHPEEDYEEVTEDAGPDAEQPENPDASDTSGS